MRGVERQKHRSQFSRNETTERRSADDAVAQVGHTRRFENADELKCGLARLEAIK
jgi:hypothetical protein